jgi:hypothetical protein
MTALTISDLTVISTAAGFDLALRGNKKAFGQFLGFSAGKEVSASLHSGKINKALDAALRRVLEALDNGTISPAADAGVAKPAVDLEAIKAATDPDHGKTDEQVLARVNKQFGFMMRYVMGGVLGKLGRFNCVLVTGPAGIGKTFPIEQYLGEYKAANPMANVVVINGAVSPVKFVEVLEECQNRGDVVVLDDADAAFKNPEFLNVFKAATDPKETRVVSWLKANADICFEFKGSVLVVSNLNLKEMAVKGSNAGHIDAMLSRSRHIDLGINSSRALALRVKYMIEEVEMFAQDFAMAGMSDLHEQAKAEIGEWIVAHKDNFRSLTLREACKVASCYIMCEGNPEWAEMAEMELGAI